MAAITCDVVLMDIVRLLLYVMWYWCIECGCYYVCYWCYLYIVFITRLEKIPFGISVGSEKGPVSEGHVEQLTWLLLQTAYST